VRLRTDACSFFGSPSGMLVLIADESALALVTVHAASN
jgi:hypothetical protein